MAILAQLPCLSLLEQHAAAAHYVNRCAHSSDHTSSAIKGVAFLIVGMLASFYSLHALDSMHASALFVQGYM